MKKSITKFLAAMFMGLMAKSEKAPDDLMMAADYSRQRNYLLTNGGKSPIPTRVLNQRQKRKKIRQQPHGK